MNPQAWRTSVTDYIRSEAQPADKYGHQPRLYALAREIAEDAAVAGQCDDDVLFAAAWMHDLGVFVGHRPADPEALAGWQHVPYTIERSRSLLAQWGFPAEKLAAVAAAIATHQPGDEPVGADAVVLRDADMLEQLGAIGVARALVKVGRDTRFQLFSDVLPVLERALSELPGRLRLNTTKALATPRIALLESFIRALREEAGAHLH